MTWLQFIGGVIPVAVAVLLAGWCYVLLRICGRRFVQVLSPVSTMIYEFHFHSGLLAIVVLRCACFLGIWLR